jgi:CBS domain-containing protein/sporulation protein YlmC with PRC-barrel domain
MGRVWDVVASLTELYPQIRGVVLRHRGALVLYPASPEEYHELLDTGHLSVREQLIEPLEFGKDDFSVRDMLWDKQIVDVDGAKVVRVNDVQFLIGKKQWIVHVDVGSTGLLRRLGFEGAARQVAKAVRRPLKDDLISWKFVQPVAGTSDGGPVRLTVAAEGLGDLHPGEFADILEDLDSEQRQVMIAAVDAETAAEALEETDDEVQRSILSGMDPDKAADILEEMEPSQAADLLASLDLQSSADIIEEIEHEEKRDITELMAYEEDTAGSLMTTDFIEIGSNATVGEAMEKMRTYAEEIESFYYMYVHDEDGKLIGVLSLRHLLQRDQALQVGNILQSRLVAVKLDTEVSEIAELFLRYNFLFVPVVDEAGMQKGVIGFKDSLDELLTPIYKAWKAD